MELNSIAAIYAANDRHREHLLETLSQVAPGEQTARPGDEKWSIQEIVEHVSLVGSGVARICAKLLDEARAAGLRGDGSFALPSSFSEKAAEIADMKVEAPERVQPTGEVSIDESLRRLESSRELIRMMQGDLAAHDLSAHKFPHPFFGPLTAAEWLVMLGAHEARHTKQIERLLTALRSS
ncbi:MAG: DinB family protein [Acidobacteria bacterium]|nr:DinB family protein [Acidobacteriota bacterium]